MILHALPVNIPPSLIQIKYNFITTPRQTTWLLSVGLLHHGAFSLFSFLLSSWVGGGGEGGTLALYRKVKCLEPQINIQTGEQFSVYPCTQAWLSSVQWEYVSDKFFFLTSLKSILTQKSFFKPVFFFSFLLLLGFLKFFLTSFKLSQTARPNQLTLTEHSK